MHPRNSNLNVNQSLLQQNRALTIGEKNCLLKNQPHKTRFCCSLLNMLVTIFLLDIFDNSGRLDAQEALVNGRFDTVTDRSSIVGTILYISAKFWLIFLNDSSF